MVALVLVAGCGEARDARSPSSKDEGPPASASAAKVANADDAKGSGVTETSHTDAGTKTETVATPAGEATTGDAPVDAPVDASESELSNRFAFDLYAKAKKPTGNMMVSGHGLRTALGVTYLGARGDTAREMKSALRFAGDASKVAANAKADLAAWQAARGKAELVVASRVWTEKTFSLDPKTTAMAADAYGAAPEPVDFKTAPENARRTINTWVATQTADKIPDLLPAGSIDKQSRMVVTNAIYFKGRWPLPFAAQATKDEAFKLGGARTKSVPMMHATESYRFAHLTGAVPVKLLEMRYEGSEMAMLVVLPDDDAGLGKLEGTLSPQTYEAWTKALAQQRVKVSLPKFTFKWGGPMAPALKELGMRTPFSPRADFAGIADTKGGERLEIGQVVQETYVAVDENGTEAAAATGVVMRTTSLPMGEPAELKADHPFLFVIHDAKRGRVLFVGRVVDPKP